MKTKNYTFSIAVNGNIHEYSIPMFAYDKLNKEQSNVLDGYRKELIQAIFSQKQLDEKKGSESDSTLSAQKKLINFYEKPEVQEILLNYSSNPLRALINDCQTVEKSMGTILDTHLPHYRVAEVLQQADCAKRNGLNVEQEQLLAAARFNAAHALLKGDDDGIRQAKDTLVAFYTMMEHVLIAEDEHITPNQLVQNDFVRLTKAVLEASTEKKIRR